MAVELCQRKAADLRAGGHANALRLEGDTDPLPRFGEGPEHQLRSLADRPPRNHAPFAPDGPVFPAVGVELDHDRLRRGRRVDPDMGKQLAAGGTGLDLTAGHEDILADAGGGAVEAPRPGHHRARLASREPGRPTGAALGGGAGGEIVVEPDRLARHRRRLRIGRGRVDVDNTRDRLFDPLFELRQLGVEGRQLRLLLGGGELDDRCRLLDVAIEAGVGRRVEEGVKRIEILG